MKSVGRHALVDVFDCDVDVLRDGQALARILHSAAVSAGATVLQARFHTFGGAGGVTGVLLLAESHISIHTWPEFGLAAVDVFLCGTMDARQVAERVAQDLGGRCWQCEVYERGRLDAV